MRLPDPARSRAVLIGTGTYASAALPDLPAVANNLDAMRRVLTDPDLGGLPPEHCVVIQDPADDTSVLDQLWNSAVEAEDTLIVYVAGHGLPGPRTGELYLAIGTTDVDRLPFRTLRYDDLRTVVMDRGRFPAANRVVVLDCCFSGRAIPAMSGESIVGLTGIEGVYILTATAANHLALAPPDAEHTAFTGELVSLLRSGVPDGPELLTLGLIYERVLHTMVSRGLPRPEQINRDTAARLALSRNAAFAAVLPAPRPAPTAAVPASPPDIRVVGIGGGGINAVNRMIEERIDGVRYISVNTDAQTLLMSDSDVKVDIGEAVRGLGSRGDPETGRLAAEAHEADLKAVLTGADLVFLACGEGGGTGSGGAPVVARVARSLGVLTVGVVTRPFAFEGRKRQAVADEGITELRKHCDTLIVIANDRLLSLGDRSVSMMDVFREADRVLDTAVRGIAGLLTAPGIIRIGFDTVRAALTGGGTALIGVGQAGGDQRVVAAARAAAGGLEHLLDDRVDGARTVLVSVSGDAGVTYDEVATAMEEIAGRAHPDAEIVFGAALDGALGPQVQVVVVAVQAF
ncbi:cell division protein FtsZ [Dactylosporangium sp. NPDC006015]|uniref:cell division protein FtsZ n=1 Tax=Dactylosporangium sp. NPDC006015 TaxID=3154576 RepID=UPI0033A46DE2